MLLFFKKRCLATALIFCFAFQSCHLIPEPWAPQEQEAGPKTTVYTIRKGAHYADYTAFNKRSTSKVRFSVTFDSTAIYSCKDTANQRDMNKLYGLSDCSTGHHSNSVRFGWRWYKNRLEVHGYTYSDKSLEAGYIGLATLGKPSVCEIRMEDQAYILTMDGKSVTFPRACAGIGEGYQLYPYFGGDEVAPHDITIAIQELL